MSIDLKKFKSKKSQIDKLVEAASADSNEKYKKDERFWSPTVDKAGNGYAIIRFLPVPDGEVPWTRYWDHGFQGPTGLWFIEKSLTSLGQDCPVSEANNVLWNSGEKGQEIARKRKRRLKYVSNILVIEDPSAPENNGKVFLFQYGKKIFDKLMEAMHPQFPGEEPMNPFDFWEGADFVMKIRFVDGFRNYDKSDFKEPSELFDGDEGKLQEVAEQIRSLAEFTDPANYKSYDELKARLDTVLGKAANTPVQEASIDEVDDDIPFPESKPADIPSQSAEEEDGNDADVDDAVAYFQRMAAED